MKVLLVEPAKPPITIGGEETFIYEPLALEYVAAGVVADHDVRLIDLRLGDDLPGTLEAFAPDVVGITAYTVHVNPVRRLFAQVKAWRPETLTVAGGHHATVRPDDFRSPAIDLVVRGEGVAAFREIVRRAERRQGFDGIAGVTFARDGRLLPGEPVVETELDGLPRPARHLTAAHRQRYFSEWMRPLASVRTSRGCPHRCTFCALWKVAGGRYLRRAPERVVDELATVDEPYVFFADDESLVDAARMHELAGRIRAAGIQKRYFLYGRSDTIVRHPDLLAAWRDVGLDRVFVGLEFAGDEDLKSIRKGSTAADNRRAVEVLHDLGLGLYASFIVRPDFTRDDFRRLEAYCHELNVDFASFGVLTPLPGTDLYDEVREQMIVQDYDYFDFIHTLLPTRLPLRDFYQAYARLFGHAMTRGRQLALLRKFPARDLPGILSLNQRFVGRVKNAYRDYEEAGSQGWGGRD